jgi:hypothetical protein
MHRWAAARRFLIWAAVAALLVASPWAAARYGP